MKLETEELLKYPQSCTFGIFHEQEKVVVLYDTINFFKTLGEILNNLQNNEYDYPSLYEARNKLTIRVINNTQNLSIRKQLFTSEVEALKEQGYTVLNKRKTLLKLKIRKMMIYYKSKPVVSVVKVNSRNEKTVMGIFKNTVEADAFIESLGCLEIIPDVHATNDLTKDYFNSKINIPLRL